MSLQQLMPRRLLLLLQLQLGQQWELRLKPRQE
jgi:hypothetical protein